MEVFYLLGRAAEAFDAADAAMRGWEHGQWRGYYQNECFSDCKFTAYLLRRVMTAVRAEGDGPHYYRWQRRFLYSGADRRIMLITNWENHLTDEELFRAMQKQRKG